MSRTLFSNSEVQIVVSTDGYFDVYPNAGRVGGERPAYRGLLAELGHGIRGGDDRLIVRPGSKILAEAVATWAKANGEAALAGSLGKGRDGNQVIPGAPAAK